MSEKITLAALINHKHQGRPIAMLTCYDYPTAVLLQQAGVDSILVGDSLAQMLLGHKTTLAATMDIMVTMTQAVRRGAPHVFLIGDMPFLSYQVSREQAITNAGRYLAEAGCDAVKMEVDHRHIDLVAAVAAAGIPVMAHLGYRPQAAGQLEKVVATRTADQALQLLEDARAMVEAGASLLLLESVTTLAAKAVTERLAIPVIGCGSGPACDGQVLVYNEVMDIPGAAGLRFCKTYAHIGQQIQNAAKAYADDIHNRNFPDEEHSYHMKPGDLAEFQRLLQDLDARTGQQR